MLQLVDICKSYTTGDYTQKALDHVNIAFRDNEFVAVLGPSGSGKTTMLNVLGGLDHADSGDLIINGISTKDYKSSDWDTYRNHRIGFIFQSYNLIPHQTVLQNVELALTLSGVSRAERKERARQALDRVGLTDHINKKPSQMSGGQMQRVAIARALVNDPDIVLADEPTGALDSETGVQVMNLLQEIASDRLVVMVTHNPELAETYATRIVNLKDGQVVDDSQPVTAEELTRGMAPVVPLGGEEVSAEAAGDVASDTVDTPESLEDGPTAAFAAVADSGDTRESAKGKKASMSFLTALSLSFNNLMTKKGRTIMTAIAGSIGIIGIAAILSLSNGVNNYIMKVEQDTLSSAPLQITKATYNMTTMFSTMAENGEFEDGSSFDPANIAADGSTVIPERKILEEAFSGVETNDLVSLKNYLESGQTDIYDHVNAIQYDYGITPVIYATNQEGELEQVNPSPINDAMGANMGVAAYMMSFNAFGEMLDAPELLQSQYDVLAGTWPKGYDECLVVINPDGTIPDFTLYHLGFYDMDIITDAIDTALDLNAVDFPEVDSTEVTYADLLDLEFKAIPSALLYRYNTDHDTWAESEDPAFVAQQAEQGITLRVTAVVCAKEGTNSSAMSQGVYYSPELIGKLIELSAQSDIVKQQLADPDTDVFTGKTFEELQNEGALDMSEMFSIDENAIQNAFKFDTSALDMSAMDLSGIDLSGLGNSVDLNALFANMPLPDMTNMQLDVDPQVQQQMTAMGLQILAGFLPWYYANNPGATIGPDTDLITPFQQYLETEEVQAQVEALNQVAGPAVADAFEKSMQSYIATTLQPYINAAINQLGSQIANQVATQISAALGSAMSSMASSLQNAFSFDADAFASAFQFNMDEEDFTALMTSYANASGLSYENNLLTLGYATDKDLQAINIYPKDFIEKDVVVDIIDDYNANMEATGNDEKVVSYTDIMGVLMSSVNDIVDKITKVLIAFVSISLVVSSIMIGIITYISVLERKKEIGILRAMGASKGNVANIFNAETIIEGLIAGVLAILVVVLVSIPVNILINALEHVERIMILPASSAVILICISVLLTLIAGFIPAIAASKKDPVEALRSE